MIYLGFSALGFLCHEERVHNILKKMLHWKYWPLIHQKQKVCIYLYIKQSRLNRRVTALIIIIMTLFAWVLFANWVDTSPCVCSSSSPLQFGTESYFNGVTEAVCSLDACTFSRKTFTLICSALKQYCEEKSGILRQTGQVCRRLPKNRDDIFIRAARVDF